MPSVTNKCDSLERDGPILEVHFSISSDLERKYREEEKPIPGPIVVNSLIDTGAASCVVAEEIPKKLGLEPVGAVNMTTPSSVGNKCYQYFMKMTIPSHNLVYEGPFIGASLEGQDIFCLVGRDVLKESILIYIGPENQFTLSIL